MFDVKPGDLLEFKKMRVVEVPHKDIIHVECEGKVYGVNPNWVAAVGEKVILDAVYVLEAEHYDYPGRIVEVYATLELANRRAAELVSIQRKAAGYTSTVAPENWELMLEPLQETYGAQDCYVEITKTIVYT